MWKAEFVSDEFACMAKETSKQTAEGTSWFLLIAYGKMRSAREKLREEL